MEQRRLRLGDILDDYCPRERRVTNHAVVAMIEEDVKQTRCTTCDAEHPYKGGQAPRRKKKEAPATLYKEVLAGKPDTDAPVTAAPVEPAPALDETHDEPIAVPDTFVADVTNADAGAEARTEAGTEVSAEAGSEDGAVEADESESDLPRVVDVEEGPVHRPLIRATLPRPEGQKDARPLPEFTVRQSGGRGGNNAGNQQFRDVNRAYRFGRGIKAGRVATAIDRRAAAPGLPARGPGRAEVKVETSGRHSSRDMAVAGASVRDSCGSLSSVTFPISVLECPPLPVEGACVFSRPS